MEHHLDIKKQSGMTLLEVTASLAIGAIIVMGALALFGGGSSAANSNAFTQNMTSIRNSVKSAFLGQGTYGTVSLNNVLIASKKVPADWTASGSTITNNFNGDVVVTGYTSTFAATTGKIPKDVCVGAIPTASQGWLKVGVGATAAAAYAAATTAPWSPATAAANCSADDQFVAFVGS